MAMVSAAMGSLSGPFVENNQGEKTKARTLTMGAGLFCVVFLTYNLLTYNL